MLPNAMLRAWKAFTFRSDFRLAYWKVTRAEVRRWLVVAAIANIVAQVFVAAPGALIGNSLAGLISVGVVGCLPDRIGGGLAPMLVIQAFGSVLVILFGHLLGLPFVLIESAAWVWAIFCSGAMGMLVLNYIQTPKTQMP